ncbi:MAG: hypothetical protein DHS20C20_16340 [Ardenticatenaceae bacterium]|nr:MAG: hypothetical protein DHS20C20_16340 [Ardenticatenaceae bacterium]
MQSTNLANSEKLDLSIPISNTSVVSFGLGLLPTLPFVIPFGILWGWRAPLQAAGSLLGTIGLFWLALLGGIIVHELLHGFTWMVASRNSPQAMTFGVNWTTLTPYAHSQAPMRAWAYRLGVVMPGLLLGFAPMLAGLANGNGWLFYFGVIFTIGAGGDFLILWLMRQVGSHQLVADHPENVGCFVYTGLNKT